MKLDHEHWNWSGCVKVKLDHEHWNYSRCVKVKKDHEQRNWSECVKLKLDHKHWNWSGCVKVKLDHEHWNWSRCVKVKLDHEHRNWSKCVKGILNQSSKDVGLHNPRSKVDGNDSAKVDQPLCFIIPRNDGQTTKKGLLYHGTNLRTTQLRQFVSLQNIQVSFKH